MLYIAVDNAARGESHQIACMLSLPACPGRVRGDTLSRHDHVVFRPILTGTIILDSGHIHLPFAAPWKAAHTDRSQSSSQRGPFEHGLVLLPFLSRRKRLSGDPVE